MIDAKEIGKQIAEDVANPPLPCYYPGGFKPPTKGHYAAAEFLAGKNYINQVNVLIGQGKREGYPISAQQSKAIWDLYLKANANPKIKVAVSQKNSPIGDLFTYFADLNHEGYVAGAQEEIEKGYFSVLKEKFPGRVREQVIEDQFVTGGERVSGTQTRELLDELKTTFDALRQEQKGTKEYTIKLNEYNNAYEAVKTMVPDAVIQKGLYDDFLRILGLNHPEPKSLQEDNNYNKEKNWVWLEEYKNKKQLNPMLFDGEKLDPQVKELLLKIATIFWDGLETDEPFEDVVLTGSSANYNYTNSSDVDLHIIIDFNKFKEPERMKKFFDMAKNNWNNTHDPKLGKHPIEIYVQDSNETHTSTGVYSVMNDEWEKKPEYESINIPDGNIKKKSKPFKEKINQLLKTGNKNPEKSIEQIKIIQERLKNFRQAGLDKNGEYSVENLAFKDLRNTGYLNKLNDLKNELIDKTISLNESFQENIQSLLNNFMSYACQELQIENPPTLEIRNEFGEEQPSFGAYVPSDHHIFINPSSRNIVDIYRTLAHELVHAKQNEMGMLTPNSGETGSDHENDANSIAGIIMRDYGKQNPKIYKIGVLNESKNDWKKTSWENEKGQKVTLPQLLDIIKDYPIIQAPIGKIKKIVIKKDTGGIESDRLNKADFKHPIIVVVDDQNNFKYILDGNHRANKAIDSNLKTIPTKLVNINKLPKKFQNVLDESETKTTVTCDNCGWTWKKKDGGKDLYVCHKCGNDNTPKNKLKEETEKNPKITRIYFDLDGVLAGFDDQFRKYNKEKLDFKEYIGKYGSSKAWDIINKGTDKYWSGMDWNPGGKELYDYVMKMAPQKNIEVWVLSSPGLDPNGDAKKGKNEWLNKHTNIPQNRRVYKQAKDKHTEAKPGYLLIDDMGKNVSEFINAGGTGIKNNPENSKESITKLHKFGL